MFTLLERESKVILAFPGLTDSSNKNIVIEPIQSVPQFVPQEEVVAKKKGGRPKKVVTEEVTPKATGKKGLSLSGKVY